MLGAGGPRLAVPAATEFEHASGASERMVAIRRASGEGVDADLLPEAGEGVHPGVDLTGRPDGIGQSDDGKKRW